MAKSIKKTSHQASKAMEKSAGGAKQDILKLYSHLEIKKNNAMNSSLFKSLGANEKGLGTTDLIEILSSDSTELLLDTLRRFEYIIDDKAIDRSKILPLAIKILRTSSDEQIRYEAARALGKLRNTDACRDLISVIENDPSEKVKEGAVKAIGAIRAKEYFAYLVELLEDVWNRSIRVRRAAAFSLRNMEPSSSIAVLSNALTNDPDSDVRKEAAESIGICLFKTEKNQAGAVARAIISQADFEKEPDAEVRIAVINSVCITEYAECIDDIIVVLKNDPNPRVRGEAAYALSRFFDPRVEKALIESLKSEKDGPQKRIALALAQYAMKNPLCLHDEMCKALIYIQKIFPRDSYIWKESVKALPAC